MLWLPSVSELYNLLDMMTTPIVWPNDATADDHDVYLAICQVVSQCDPLQLSFEHILSHQDKDPTWQLTVAEQLNVDCDQWAKHLPHSSTAYVNPAIPVAQPHLIINGKIVCNKYIMAIFTTTDIYSWLHQLSTKTALDAQKHALHILDCTPAGFKAAPDKW